MRHFALLTLLAAFAGSALTQGPPLQRDGLAGTAPTDTLKIHAPPVIYRPAVLYYVSPRYGVLDQDVTGLYIVKLPQDQIERPCVALKEEDDIAQILCIPERSQKDVIPPLRT